MTVSRWYSSAYVSLWVLWYLPAFKYVQDEGPEWIFHVQWLCLVDVAPTAPFLISTSSFGLDGMFGVIVWSEDSYFRYSREPDKLIRGKVIMFVIAFDLLYFMVLLFAADSGVSRWYEDFCLQTQVSNQSLPATNPYACQCTLHHGQCFCRFLTWPSFFLDGTIASNLLSNDGSCANLLQHCYPIGYSWM